MFDPNPIALLGLNHYEYNHIDEQLIRRAVNNLLDKSKSAPIIVDGNTIDQTFINEAAQQLSSETERAFYYQLHKYPGLAAFLKGEKQAVIETNSLRLHADQLVEKSAEILAPRASLLAQKAFEENEVSAFEAFQVQVGKGPRHFQEKVFEGLRQEIDQRKKDLSQTVEEVLSGTIPSSQLRGMHLLQQQVPVHMINALPSIFDEDRNQMRNSLGRLVHYLGNNDEKDLALTIARYARRINGEAAYTEKLDKIINQWQRNKSKRVAPSRSRDNVMVLSILGIIVFVGGAIYYFMTAFNSPSPSGSTTYESPATTSESEEEAIFGENLYPHLQLPWYERGAAVESSSTGEVKKGSSPMLVCFPTKMMSGEERRVVVMGDPAYDALVFFFNGESYFEQAYIPAKSQYVMNHALPGKMVSTMIIFGKAWDAEVYSPCETKGFFTEKIFYGGFSSYATDPPYLNLATEDVLMLKKRRLMPSRQMEEHEFFELLEKYRK
jgi:hypothetical protein